MERHQTLVQALQEAIKDYNTWAISRAKDYDSVKAYGELRGILYNKLVTQLREVEGFMVKHRSFYNRSLLSTDLFCKFDGSSLLLQLMIIPPTHPNSGARGELLLELGKAVEGVIYTLLQSPLEYEIASAVARIQAYTV